LWIIASLVKSQTKSVWLNLASERWQGTTWLGVEGVFLFFSHLEPHGWNCKAPPLPLLRLPTRAPHSAPTSSTFRPPDWERDGHVAIDSGGDQFLQ